MEQELLEMAASWKQTALEMIQKSDAFERVSAHGAAELKNSRLA